MPPDPILFAGLEFSSGRKPVTFAGLDEDLKVVILERWDVSQVVSCLQTYETGVVAVSLPGTKQGKEGLADLKGKCLSAGFKPFSQKSSPRQWIETDGQDCFRTLSGHPLLAHRSLEGRLQRSAILYEQGLQIADPVDLLEEITRYKLVQGILPLDDLPSWRELDALVAGYLAWMTVNRPGQVVPKGAFVLPAAE